jgi:tetratricopeptide (TPR) repeat protein
MRKIFYAAFCKTMLCTTLCATTFLVSQNSFAQNSAEAPQVALPALGDVQPENPEDAANKALSFAQEETAVAPQPANPIPAPALPTPQAVNPTPAPAPVATVEPAPAVPAPQPIPVAAVPQPMAPQVEQASAQPAIPQAAPAVEVPVAQAPVRSQLDASQPQEVMQQQNMAPVAVAPTQIQPTPAPLAVAPIAPAMPMSEVTNTQDTGEVKISSDPSANVNVEKTAEENTEEKAPQKKSKAKTAKNKAKKKEYDFSDMKSNGDSIQILPKSFSKASGFNAVTEKNSEVWIPASSASSSRVQDISSPNLLLNNEDEDFLSSLKIPDKSKKPTEEKSDKKIVSSDVEKIEMKKDNFKDLDLDSEKVAKDAITPASPQDTIGNPATVEVAGGQNSPKPAEPFNALDGLNESEVVDAAEVKEIEVDSLDYASANAEGSTASAQKKNFYMRDTSMKVEVKSQAKADLKTMRDAYDALQSGQVESAIEYYKKANLENPSNNKILFGLATAYHIAGQRSDAKATYKKIIKNDPSFLQAINNYIVIVGEEGGERAIKELQNLMSKNPKYALIPAQIGAIYFKSKDYEKAAQYYSMAVNLDYNNNDYKYNLAITFDKLGAFARARNLYGELIEKAFQGDAQTFDVQQVKERYMEISGRT